MTETTPSPPSPTSVPIPPSKSRHHRAGPGDILFLGIFGVAGGLVLLLVVALVGILANNSTITIKAFGFRLLTTPGWNPGAGVYGALPFVYGTLITSALALLIAVPLSLGAAIFLTSVAPHALRRPVGTAIELLAAVPSVIYGLWGIYVLEPIMGDTVDPKLQHFLGWTGAFSGSTGPSAGSSVLTAGVILAIMIVPTICAVSRDALNAVPAAQKEAALSLGATTWESTRTALIPYARSGIIGGIILGLGRGMGETIAVAMVIGNTPSIPHSLFDPASTLSSWIAVDIFSTNGPVEYSALFEFGLILLLIALFVNIVARLLVWKVLNVSAGPVE